MLFPFFFSKIWILAIIVVYFCDFTKIFADFCDRDPDPYHRYWFESGRLKLYGYDQIRIWIHITENNMCIVCVYHTKILTPISILEIYCGVNFCFSKFQTYFKHVYKKCPEWRFKKKGVLLTQNFNKLCNIYGAKLKKVWRLIRARYTELTKRNQFFFVPRFWTYRVTS